MICQTPIRPVSVSAIRVRAWIIARSCATNTVRRRSQRSVNTPAMGAHQCGGDLRRKSHHAERGTRSCSGDSISQTMAICCIQVPITEMPWPTEEEPEVAMGQGSPHGLPAGSCESCFGLRRPRSSRSVVLRSPCPARFVPAARSSGAGRRIMPKNAGMSKTNRPHPQGLSRAAVFGAVPAASDGLPLRVGQNGPSRGLPGGFVGVLSSCAAHT